MRAGSGEARARAALAGNPSDRFGGAVLAVTLAHWSARVDVAPARHDEVDPPEARALVTAALTRWRRSTGSTDAVAVRVRTSIPRHAGLGGSSAIVIATLRALGSATSAPMATGVLAHEALRAEVEELGLLAGPQDRVVQAHEGLLLMDFHAGWRHRRIAIERLPPLLVAHRQSPSRPSSQTHRALRETQSVRAAMRRLHRLAFDAAGALADGDLIGFATCMEATLDVRRGVAALDPAEEEGAAIAKEHGAAANYAGSGGAVVTAVPDDEEGLLAAWRSAGWEGRRLVPHGPLADQVVDVL